MLYTKQNDKLIPIFENELYSICPICKKEVNVNEMFDLEEDEELFHELVFTKAQVYCADCSEYLNAKLPKKINTQYEALVTLIHLFRDYRDTYQIDLDELEKVISYFKANCYKEAHGND